MAKVSIRVPDADLAEIDRRASSAGMTRTAFVMRAALDLATADEQRFDEIENRLARAEEMLFSR